VPIPTATPATDATIGFSPPANALEELQHRRIFARRRRFHEVFEIIAGAERPLAAADDDRTHGGVFMRVTQRIGHHLIHRRGDRILLLGPIEGDRHHAIAAALNHNIHRLSPYEKRSAAPKHRSEAHEPS
jgi:hypothetical protein